MLPYQKSWSRKSCLHCSMDRSFSSSSSADKVLRNCLFPERISRQLPWYSIPCADFHMLDPSLLIITQGEIRSLLFNVQVILFFFLFQFHYLEIRTSIKHVELFFEWLWRIHWRARKITFFSVLFWRIEMQLMIEEERKRTVFLGLKRVHRVPG